MHRRYRPYSPVTCLLLKQRWDKVVFESNMKKIRAAKAVIDNRAPIVNHHVYIKLKKHEYETEREKVIIRDNQELYRKMYHIMRTRGRIDHINTSLRYRKSENATKHKNELIRVAKENSAILKRLSEHEPNYNHKQDLMDYLESEYYLKKISRYPPPKRPALIPFHLGPKKMKYGPKTRNKRYKN
ncbi:sperm axonemal maintenance protein CFAP97D1-like [Ruditapes philippinarum]|uniref:sperm axonemal maintenance protein CFAP97D1-like n=1 Tax=Ruditapes philippinarum TaxID=129788 RepID=UPI00295ABCD8|nr:sperm axonemal maintenance protein CFAP97D1-like [Ruditapes philippinarum]